MSRRRQRDPQRVYVALPALAYGTARHSAALEVAARLHPEAKIVDPATLFASSADWLERWPEMLNALDALVVAPGPRGWIGTGVLREVADAIAAGVPVTFLDAELRPASPGSIWLRFDSRPHRHLAARVVVEREA